MDFIKKPRYSYSVSRRNLKKVYLSTPDGKCRFIICLSHEGEVDFTALAAVGQRSPATGRCTERIIERFTQYGGFFSIIQDVKRRTGAR